MSLWDKKVRFFKIFAETSSHLRRINRACRHAKGFDAQAIHPLMMQWGKRMLEALNVELTLSGLPPSEGALFLGNHVSYVDIPLLMSVAPVVFIAKEEVASWPIIGAACRSVGTVFVRRESRQSRQRAGEAIARRWADGKQSIVIFPSGTTKLDESEPWRRGAFDIAKRYRIPLQPFHLTYRPLRKVAYVGDDVFVPHLWALLGESKIEARLELAPPRWVEDVEKDRAELWQTARGWLERDPFVDSPGR